MLADRPAGPVPGGYPVSVKGVVVRDGRVLLLRNDRAEWELPGGRLEPGETPPQCVVREIAEENMQKQQAPEFKYSGNAAAPWAEARGFEPRMGANPNRISSAAP
jgi:ADP-ribose pyrophosphatase YjhB (NUDIX family)